MPEWQDDPAIEQRIDELLAQMTLAGKLGQLNQVGGDHATGPDTGHRPYEDLIATGEVGAILNVTGARRTNELQRLAVEQSHLKIPLLLGFDVSHGYRTAFPIPLALASTWDAELVERTAAAAAREAAADGIRWTFAPMVDIARDARWGRILEGSGEDPWLGAVMAAAYVRGFQGQRLGDPTSVAACPKHFVGYGAAEAGRDYNSTYIPERLLREVYLPPFEAAIDAGAATLMTAFNALNDVPASANAFTIDRILKRDWRFRGFVVSDWGAIKELIAHGIAADGATAARKAITAGVDMDMESGLYASELPDLIAADAVQSSLVDDAVRRVLRVKLALGLFERPYVDEQPPAALELELARRAAAASFVLLKNDGVLPLAARKLALIGELADDARSMLGAWPGIADPAAVTTLRAALAARRDLDVTYARDDAAIAERSDVAVLAVGEPAEMSGEAASRTRLDLPGDQAQLIEAVARTGTPIVLVVFGGRPLALAPYVDHAAAIVQAWQPGVAAGPALVDVLAGDANFSGRLTVSMPRSVGQLPLYYNALATGRPAGSHERYKAHYIDEQITPLFAFGFGLSYTRFEYSPVTLSARSMRVGDRITAHATVTNAGSRDGVETVQLYLRRRGTSVALPVRELKGFRRVLLRAGESREIGFTLGTAELAFWNIELAKTVEPASVSVWIAPDAARGEPAELTITP